MTRISSPPCRGGVPAQPAGWCALAIVVMLGGCAVGPDYRRPDAAVPAAYKEAGEWKVAQPRDDASRGKWWEVFGDPQLNALIEQVEISNQNVLAAEAQFRQARAVIAASRSALFPTLGGNVSVKIGRASCRERVFVGV